MLWGWYALALVVGILTYHWTKAIIWWLNDRHESNRQQRARDNAKW